MLNRHSTFRMKVVPLLLVSGEGLSLSSFIGYNNVPHRSIASIGQHVLTSREKVAFQSSSQNRKLQHDQLKLCPSMASAAYSLVSDQKPFDH